MTDKEPNLGNEIPKDVLDFAVARIKQVAQENEVNEKVLANQVAERLNIDDSFVPVEPAHTDEAQRNDDNINSFTTEQGSKSNPFDLYINSIKDYERKGDTVAAAVIAYGKIQGSSGATDFVNFGTQSSYGYQFFENLFGASHLDLRRGEKFDTRSGVKFLDSINSRDVYPPAIMVIQDGDNVILFSARYMEEGAYAKSLGNRPVNNRPYFDYRAFIISADEIKDLTNKGIP